MVEEADAGEGHSYAVFIASLDDIVITHRTTSLGDELHTALVGALDVVAEGEECI